MRIVAILLVLLSSVSVTASAEEPEISPKGWPSWGNGPVAQFFKGRRPSLLQRVFGEREEQAEKEWQLTLRCREALAKDKDLAGHNLDVSVEQGIAMLEGPIANSELRDRAGKVIQGVKGIRGLRNELRITTLPKPGTPAPRHFPALDQKTPIKLGQPIQPGPTPKPTDPPARLMGQSRDDSSWIKSDWPRSNAQALQPSTDVGDPRAAIAHVLRANVGFGDVRFGVEGNVVWLRGRVATQTRHQDLLRAVLGILGQEWRLMDQIRID